MSAISEARIQSGGWGVARQMHQCTIGRRFDFQQCPPAINWRICAYILDAPQTTRSFGAAYIPPLITNNSSMNIHGPWTLSIHYFAMKLPSKRLTPKFHFRIGNCSVCTQPMARSLHRNHWWWVVSTLPERIRSVGMIIPDRVEEIETTKPD